MPDILEMIKESKKIKENKKEEIFKNEKYNHCCSCYYQFEKNNPCKYCEAIYDEDGEEDLDPPSEWIYEDEEGDYK